MPALYSLAQHAALSEAAAGLQEGGEGDTIFTFLDDTYVVSAPGRTGVLHGGALEAAFRSHARIRLHDGKTRIWNAAGGEPHGIAALQPAGADPVWTGFLVSSSGSARVACTRGALRKRRLRAAGVA